MTLRNIKLNLPNRYILSVSNEMLEANDGLVKVVLLDPNKNFVNTWFWINKSAADLKLYGYHYRNDDVPNADYDGWPDVERFIGARHLSKLIDLAFAYAEGDIDAKI